MLPDSFSTWNLQICSGILAFIVNLCWFYVLGRIESQSEESEANTNKKSTIVNSEIPNGESLSNVQNNKTESASSSGSQCNLPRLTSPHQRLSGPSSLVPVDHGAPPDHATTNQTTKAINPSLLSMFMALSIPISFVLDVLFHQHWPTPMEAAGQGIVIASFLVSYWGP